MTENWHLTCTTSVNMSKCKNIPCEKHGSMLHVVPFCMCRICFTSFQPWSRARRRLWFKQEGNYLTIIIKASLQICHTESYRSPLPRSITRLQQRKKGLFLKCLQRIHLTIVCQASENASAISCKFSFKLDKMFFSRQRPNGLTFWKITLISDRFHETVSLAHPKWPGHAYFKPNLANRACNWNLQNCPTINLSFAPGALSCIDISGCLWRFLKFRKEGGRDEEEGKQGATVNTKFPHKTTDVGKFSFNTANKNPVMGNACQCWRIATTIFHYFKVWRKMKKMSFSSSCHKDVSLVLSHTERDFPTNTSPRISSYEASIETNP